MDEGSLIAIAAACHQQNKAWCEANGDLSQKDWSETPVDIQASAVDGVTKALAGHGPAELHESWAAFKRADGWVYGPTKDAEAKTHPCLVPYADLPEIQKRKDSLFIAMVNELAQILGVTIPESDNT
jgi:hypothetical protein